MISTGWPEEMPADKSPKSYVNRKVPAQMAHAEPIMHRYVRGKDLAISTQKLCGETIARLLRYLKPPSENFASMRPALLYAQAHPTKEFPLLPTLRLANTR